MNNQDLLKKAIHIAQQAHFYQLDRYGAPYLGHVTRVMNMGQTIDEKIIGILHDLVEDTSWTFELLATEGFPEYIIEAIRCVTKKNDLEDYDEYIKRSQNNPIAIKVKLNDLTDNLDIRRMEIITEKDLTRMNKYLKAYKYLKGINSF